MSTNFYRWWQLPGRAVKMVWALIASFAGDLNLKPKHKCKTCMDYHADPTHPSRGWCHFETPAQSVEGNGTCDLWGKP